MADIFNDFQSLLTSEVPRYAAFLARQQEVYADLSSADLARARSIFRLVRALQSFADHRAGTMDVAVLIRQVIRTYHRRLSIPLALWGVIEQRCSEASLRQTHLEQDGMVELAADDWLPIWLPQAHAIDVLEPRRHDTSVIGDGIVHAMNNWTAYRSQAQKAAVTMALFGAPGSTTLVTLPTGGGKSLCAVLPAWSETKGGQIHGGTTIVVVPTVSLALDQEQHAQHLFDHAVSPEHAPHSLTGSTPPDVRATIEAGLRNGTLPLLFISPESLLGSLKQACFEAARQGTLQRLVIDEAHLVETWGAGFRTEFQLLGAFRRQLLAASAGRLRTLLLSATISDTSEPMLRQLFADTSDEGWVRVQADQLRPEISYWFDIAPTIEMRQTHVIEALAHLPRPVILYVTKPEEADAWQQLLVRRGFERLATYTGKTDPAERLRLVQEWNSDKRDLMIATSAFGLGVDKPNVRTIIHACLPESIARFYQEVGRAGRDGYSAISLTCIVAKQDAEAAKTMSNSARITAERALERWQGMQKSSRSHQQSGDEVLLDLDAVPRAEEHLRRSPINRGWNEHILLLMQRAGLIKLIDVPQQNVFDDQLDATTGYRLPIKVLQHHEINDETGFTNAFEPLRNKELRTLRKDLQRLVSVIESAAQPHPMRCIATALTEAYPHATAACGGCPFCRSQGRTPYTESLALSIDCTVPQQPHFYTHSALAEHLGSMRSLLVLWDGERQFDRLVELPTILAGLVVQGVRQLVVADELLERDTAAVDIMRALARHPDRPHTLTPASWATAHSSYPVLPLPTAVVYPTDDRAADVLYREVAHRLSAVPVVHIAHRSLYLESEYGSFAARVNGIAHSFESLQLLLQPNDMLDLF